MMLKKYLNKKRAIKKNKMLQSIIGIGDILVYEVDRNNDERIISTLKELYQLMDSLFSIKKSNIKKFDRLILSKEYFDLCEINTQQAQLNLAFSPEKYADGFEAILSQVERVYKRAVQENNVVISRFSIYTLNMILKLLSSENDNQLFIDQILNKSGDIILESVNKNELRIFSCAIGIYKNIVFSLDNKFQMGYLKSFDNYLFATAKYIVTQNKLDFFKELTSNMTDGVLTDIGSRDIWDYGHLLLQDIKVYGELEKQYGIENKLKYLDDYSTKIYSIKDLEDWLNEFNTLKLIVESNLKKAEIDKAKNLENNILKSINNKFKSNNLRNLFISIGAFCLFEKKINFIKFLWGYKQPEDADAIWICHDLIPENLDELMTVYFDLMGGRVNFFVGHHGSTIYIKQYFLLLLGKFLQNKRKNNLNYKPERLYRLPDLDIYTLSDLTHRCDNLIEDAKKFILSKNIFSEFEFENPDELFNDKIIPFIEHIKLEAINQISAKHKNFPVSESKIEEFKDELIKKFYNLATMRDILTNYFNVYKYVNDVAPDKSSFGINIIEDKAVFFESWHVQYSNWQDGFARSISNGEDHLLFKEIMDRCQLSRAKKFEDALAISGSLNDLIIVTSGVNIWKYFEGKEQFKAGWRNDVEKLMIKGFDGWFEQGGVQIPIFGITNTGQENIILILNKANFGCLYQYVPMSDNTDPSLRRDIFYMNIKLLTERDDLIKKFRSAPPEWLTKIGDDVAQKAYIQERVVIEIYEKFEFIPSDHFQGYKWEII